mmetsp:Transcript_4261/g.6523  ORF Transcript_4261/g.6523 Transcript_4261/m.6523 type:complete len:281 (+) Transcript_4261:97-939(+)
MKVDLSFLQTTISSTRRPTRQLTINEESDTKKSPVDLELLPLTVFEQLYTEAGSKAIKRWFTSQTAQDSHANVYNLGYGSLGTAPSALSETQFLNLMRRMSDLPTHSIIDLFDLLDNRDDSGTLGFQEAFLVISIFAARESGQMTLFLHKHGRDLFEHVASPWACIGRSLLPSASMPLIYAPPRVSVDSSRKLVAIVLGVPFKSIAATFAEVGLSAVDSLSYEDFSLFLYAIFKEWDLSRAPIAANTSSTKRTKSKGWRTVQAIHPVMSKQHQKKWCVIL